MRPEEGGPGAVPGPHPADPRRHGPGRARCRDPQHPAPGPEGPRAVREAEAPDQRQRPGPLRGRPSERPLAVRHAGGALAAGPRQARQAAPSVPLRLHRRPQPPAAVWTFLLQGRPARPGAGLPPGRAPARAAPEGVLRQRRDVSQQAHAAGRRRPGHPPHRVHNAVSADGPRQGRGIQPTVPFGLHRRGQGVVHRDPRRAERGVPGLGGAVLQQTHSRRDEPDPTGPLEGRAGDRSAPRRGGPAAWLPVDGEAHARQDRRVLPAGPPLPGRHGAGPEAGRGPLRPRAPRRARGLAREALPGAGPALPGPHPPATEAHREHRGPTTPARGQADRGLARSPGRRARSGPRPRPGEGAEGGAGAPTVAGRGRRRRPAQPARRRRVRRGRGVRLAGALRAAGHRARRRPAGLRLPSMGTSLHVQEYLDMLHAALLQGGEA